MVNWIPNEAAIKSPWLQDLDSNQTKVRLRKQQLGDDFGLGITLITGSLYSDNPGNPTQSGTGQPDRVNIRFQLENS